jgi:hypothetical protein
MLNEDILDKMDSEIKDALVNGLQGQNFHSPRTQEVAKQTILNILLKYKDLGIDVAGDAIEDVAEEYAKDVMESIRSTLGNIH